jgi:hypothetical protein
VPSQQLQGQLQTWHSADTGKYIMDKKNIDSWVNYRKGQEHKRNNAENRTDKLTKEDDM